MDGGRTTGGAGRVRGDELIIIIVGGGGADGYTAAATTTATTGPPTLTRLYYSLWGSIYTRAYSNGARRRCPFRVYTALYGEGVSPSTRPSPELHGFERRRIPLETAAATIMMVPWSSSTTNRVARITRIIIIIIYYYVNHRRRPLLISNFHVLYIIILKSRKSFLTTTQPIKNSPGKERINRWKNRENKTRRGN